MSKIIFYYNVSSKYQFRKVTFSVDSTNIFVDLHFHLAPIFFFQKELENTLGQIYDAQEAGESNGHGPSC